MSFLVLGLSLAVGLNRQYDFYAKAYSLNLAKLKSQSAKLEVAVGTAIALFPFAGIVLPSLG